MSASEWAVLVVANIACVAGISIAIGITAPRWPLRWFTDNRGPLRWQLPGEEVAFQRAVRGRWGQRLPELGAMFGGVSKSSLPGRDLASLRSYAIEVRRAEWVHLLSLFTFIPMLWFNPWWLSVLFGVIAIGVNLPFLIVLRYNRKRLERLIDRRSRTN